MGRQYALPIKQVKIGQTIPPSGPPLLSALWRGRADKEAAYFKMINEHEQGGVNGRKLNLISLDDGYSPPKTVEQTRRLVEQNRRLGALPLQQPRHAAESGDPAISQ